MPFPVQAPLSGIARGDTAGWYRRLFTVPAAWHGQRVLLNFGAVSWRSRVWVNGHLVGGHRGDYDGFSFDITRELHRQGPNELIVGYSNPVGGAGEPVGKQAPGAPGGITHTASSGIWQTVWLEPVAAQHLTDLELIPDVAHSRLVIRPTVAGGTRGLTLSVLALAGARGVASASGPAGGELSVPLAHPQLWWPWQPYLYGLRVALRSGTQTIDRASSLFGMRSVTLGRVAGATRILINGRFVFQTGGLDQGYWPDGVYSAPSDAAMQFDVSEAKALGYNMLREHAKVRAGPLVPVGRPHGSARLAGHAGNLALPDPSSNRRGPGRVQGRAGANRDPAALPSVDRHLDPVQRGMGPVRSRRYHRRGAAARPGHADRYPERGRELLRCPGDDGERHPGLAPVQRSVRGAARPPGVRGRGVRRRPAVPAPSAPLARPAVQRRQPRRELARRLDQWGAPPPVRDAGAGDARRGTVRSVFTEYASPEAELGLVTPDREAVTVAPSLLRSLNQPLIQASLRLGGPLRSSPIRRAPAGTVGLWPLTTAHGSTSPDLSGYGHPLTLLPGARFTPGPHRRPALRLPGTGTAVTTAPVLNTGGSITVSAWLRSDRYGQSGTAVAQQGTVGSEFALGVSTDRGRQGQARVGTTALGVLPPQTRTWWSFTGANGAGCPLVTVWGAGDDGL